MKGLMLLHSRIQVYKNFKELHQSVAKCVSNLWIFFAKRTFRTNIGTQSFWTRMRFELRESQGTVMKRNEEICADMQ